MRLIAGAIVAALILAACGNETDDANTGAGATPPEESNTVDVSLTEYAFGMPEELTGGVITFNFTNAGELPHEVAFGAIEEGRDADDVRRAIERGGEPPEWFEDIAGIPVLSPGVTASMTRELDEGGYVFLCFLPTPEGQPHVAEGMYRYFELSGTSDAEMPEGDLTITATDDGFDVPEITAGTHTIRLINDASEGREFAFYSLEEGKTTKDIDRWFESGFETPTPVLFPGGMQSVEPGTEIAIEITFESGRTYTLEDFESETEVEFEV